MRRSLRLSLFVCASLAPLAPLRAQCDEWSHEFALSGFDGSVLAYASAPSAHGTLLFAGGSFRHVDELPAGGIAQWDGARWSAVGGGFDGSVTCLAAYDDGSGLALYAGGNFGSVTTLGGTLPCHGIARWDGSEWSAVGGAGAEGLGAGLAFALRVCDLGSGPALYVGGSFDSAGGAPAHNLARWSAAGWESVGTGTTGPVAALCVFDAGSGPRLALGGLFAQCGGVPANNVALCDGSSFSALGSGTNGFVRALCSYDAGGVPALAAGGNFGTAGGHAFPNVAAWMNGAWQPLGPGLDAGVQSLALFDEGAGPRLFAGGVFTQRLARWNGASWAALGSGSELDTSSDAQLPILGVHDDGAGARLYLGCGARIATGQWTHGLARWNGQAFEAAGALRNHVLDGVASELAACAGPAGPMLVAAGDFQHAGGDFVNHIAQWSGAQWTGFGTGLYGQPNAPVSVHEAGATPLYVALLGAGSTLMRWSGSAWSVVYDTKSASFFTSGCAYDDGSGEALYVAGRFTHIDAVQAAGIARFDGTAFHALGAGLVQTGTTPTIPALRVLDLGQGPVLVAGGTFTSAGGQPAQHVAVWNGASWAALGAGLDSLPLDFEVVDHGSGPVLYAACTAGSFGTLARWNGTAWSSVPLAPDGPVLALARFDDGSGAQLVAGGQFAHAGGSTARSLARWNGTQWSEIPGGMNVGASPGAVTALCVFDDGAGSGPALYAGGNFTNSGGVLSPFLAKWSGCSGPIGSFCHGDGSAFPCPCGNDGAAGHGCANSADPAGAVLAWSGSTNPDTLVLSSTGQIGNNLSVCLQGDALLAHTAFGDGLRCIGGELRRLYIRPAVGGVFSAPLAGEPAIGARAQALGDALAPGSTRYYQVYYRDLQSSFCPARFGNRFNVTNGIVVHW